MNTETKEKIRKELENMPKILHRLDLTLEKRSRRAKEILSEILEEIHEIPTEERHWTWDEWNEEKDGTYLWVE